MLGLSAFALALTAYGAQADVMPVQNLTFNQFFPGGLAPKAIVHHDQCQLDGLAVTGLISIDAPGTATYPVGPRQFVRSCWPFR